MNTETKRKVLELLENDARLTPDKIAVMLGENTEDIKKLIAEFEADGTLLGYKAIVDWEKAEKESVTAFIELRVTPQADRGFEKIAERIYNYPEVNAVYLISGSYDYLVSIDGKTLMEVSRFVSEKLSTLEGVVGTTTHFVLKKYKDHGTILKHEKKEERIPVMP